MWKLPYIPKHQTGNKEATIMLHVDLLQVILGLFIDIWNTHHACSETLLQQTVYRLAYQMNYYSNRLLNANPIPLTKVN